MKFDDLSFSQKIGLFFIIVGVILWGITLTSYNINEKMDTKTVILGLGVGVVFMGIGALIYNVA